MKFWLIGVIAAVLGSSLLMFSGSAPVAQADTVEDACGVEGILDVPDSGSTFDFREACLAHDGCYNEGGTEADRRACDEEFLELMLASCEKNWPDNRLMRRLCANVAWTYYFGVRAGGWLSFNYGGLNPD